MRWCAGLLALLLVGCIEPEEYRATRATSINAWAQHAGVKVVDYSCAPDAVNNYTEGRERCTVRDDKGKLWCIKGYWNRGYAMCSNEGGE